MRSASLITLLLFAFHVYAQRVSNVRAEQQGRDLVISYDLEADGPVAIELFVSNDQGNSWQGPLSNCSGDVGKNVVAGTSKRIRWALLEESELAGDAIRFKVMARPTTMDKAEVARRPWLNPSLTYGVVADIDGNSYATIRIGTQVWMAENLRSSQYRDGSSIPNVKDDALWTKLTTHAWCNYDNDSRHDFIYGKLYNWYAAVDYRGLCPKDWHLPSDVEWTTLVDFLGGEAVAGGQMKSKDTAQWNAPNKGATNTSGFTGTGGGTRNDFDGGFYRFHEQGYWWSGQEYPSGALYSRFLADDEVEVFRLLTTQNEGYCVRCVRD